MRSQHQIDVLFSFSVFQVVKKCQNLNISERGSISQNISVAILSQELRMKSSAVSILTRSLSSNHIMRPSVSASEELSRKLFDRIESDSPYGSFSVANCPRNHNLNRWCNVLPFDNTRIKLCPTGNILNFLRWQSSFY